MNRLTRLLNSKKGASLIIVIVVFAVLSILGTTLLTVASFNQKNSVLYHNQRQAYYTARSVAEAMVEKMYDQIDGEKVYNLLSKGVVTTSKKTQVDNMGEYYLELTLLEDAIGKRKLKIKANATYGISQPASSSVSVILKEGKGNRINPIEFALFSVQGLTQPTASPARTTTIDGDVLTRGSLTLGKSQIQGNLISVGALVLKDTQVIGLKNRVIGVGDGGNINLPLGTTIEGSFYTTKASAGLYNSYTINGDYIHPSAINLPVQSGGSLDFSKNFGISVDQIGMNGTVERDLKPLSHNIVSTSGDNCYLYNGAIYDRVGQKLKFPDGSVITFWSYPNGMVKAPWTDRTRPEPVATPRDPSDSPILNCYGGAVVNFTARTVTFADGLQLNIGGVGGTSPNTLSTGNFSINLNAQTVTTDGGITTLPLEDVSVRWNEALDKYVCNTLPTSEKFMISGDPTYTFTSDARIKSDTDTFRNAEFVFDTNAAGQDMNIYLKDDNGILKLEDIKFTVKGDYNVYVFLPKGLKLTCGQGTILGENAQDGTQMYLIGEDIHLEMLSNSRFKGIAYLYGVASAYTDDYVPMSKPKVEGSITANTIRIADGNTYKYNEYFKEPDFNATLRMDIFFKYTDKPEPYVPWEATYGE